MGVAVYRKSTVEEKVAHSAYALRLIQMLFMLTLFMNSNLSASVDLCQLYLFVRE